MVGLFLSLRHKFKLDPQFQAELQQQQCDGRSIGKRVQRETFSALQKQTKII
jgi:hypothetical protein